MGLQADETTRELAFCAHAILVPETDVDGALRVAEKIRGLEVGRMAAWPHGPVTASMGISAALPGAKTNPPILVAQAGKALYLAKESGRDCARAFSGW